MKNGNAVWMIIACIALVVVTVIATVELMKVNGFVITKTAYAGELELFTEIYRYSGRYYVMVDNHNGVMYVVSHDKSYWTPMLNDDGSPRIYEGWPECVSR